MEKPAVASGPMVERPSSQERKTGPQGSVPGGNRPLVAVPQNQRSKRGERGNPYSGANPFGSRRFAVAANRKRATWTGEVTGRTFA
jgi:hypothetical protein